MLHDAGQDPTGYKKHDYRPHSLETCINAVAEAGTQTESGGRNNVMVEQLWRTLVADCKPDDKNALTKASPEGGFEYVQADWE